MRKFFPKNDSSKDVIKQGEAGSGWLDIGILVSHENTSKMYKNAVIRRAAWVRVNE